MKSSLTYRSVLPTAVLPVSVEDLDTAPERQASQATTHCTMLAPSNFTIFNDIV